MRTIGTNALWLYQDERCLHLMQSLSPEWMRLGIASKAKWEPADNKLFIKALASLSLKNVKPLLTHPWKNNYRAKRMLLRICNKRKKNYMLCSKLVLKIFISRFLFWCFYFSDLLLWHSLYSISLRLIWLNFSALWICFFELSCCLILSCILHSGPNTSDPWNSLIYFGHNPRIQC